MFDATLRSAVWQLISPIVAPLTLIWADQNAPRPALPYLTLRLMAATPAENDARGEVTADGEQDLDNPTSATLEVQAYGTGAENAIASLTKRLRFDQHVDRAVQLGIAIGRRIGVTNLSQLVSDSQFEERAMLEVALLFSGHDVDPVGLIETVEVEGEMTGTTTTEHLDVTLTISEGETDGEP